MPSLPRITSIRQLSKLRRALESHDLFGLRFLLDAGNGYSRTRVAEVGPDRAAAEWIVRCGGRVKFDTINEEFSDYNWLIKRVSDLDPTVAAENIHVTHIDATDAGITGNGCEHFEKLRHLVQVRFVRCANLKDHGLEHMGKALREHLPHLHIESCRRISEYGLGHLHKLKGLKTLKLIDLPGVRGADAVLVELKKALPECEITYPDAR